MFLGFVHFYQWFIQGFSKIAASLTSILKITLIAGARISSKAIDNFIFLTCEAKLALL